MQVTVTVCTSPCPPMNFDAEIFVRWSVFILNIRELQAEGKVAMPAPVCLSKCHHLAKALHKVTATGLCGETPSGAAEASVSPDRLLCCESCHGKLGVWRAQVVSGGIAGRFQGAHCQVCSCTPRPPAPGLRRQGEDSQALPLSRMPSAWQNNFC